MYQHPARPDHNPSFTENEAMAKTANSTLTPAAPGAPSRRSIFGAITALACIPVLGVSAVPDPDAGLIRLCAEFHKAHAATLSAPDDTDEWEIHLDRRWEISDRLEGMTPTTQLGRNAKLKVALVLMLEDLHGSRHEDFVLSAFEAFISNGAA